MLKSGVQQSHDNLLIFSLLSLFLFNHKIQITIKHGSCKKASESGEEAQKETMRLIDIDLPQSKNKVNSNSKANEDK